MIAYRALKGMFDGRLRESTAHDNSPAAYHRGRMAAVKELHETLGLVHDGRNGTCSYNFDERGLPVSRPGAARATELNIRHIAEAIFGHERVEELFHPASGMNFGALREAAIDPSAFVDINTLTLSVSGLVNAEILERFNQPDLIGRNLLTIKPTQMNGQKIIGVSRQPKVTSTAKGRQPGEEHTSTGFGSAYQTTPTTTEQALKCSVTREAVFFDLTGQVLDEAGNIGEELGYGWEITIADEILGVTNSYNRSGTSYNTYQTLSPWINDGSNAFSDETSVDTARQLFIGMTDPETGKEIRVGGRDILCMQARELKFREQLFGSNIQLGTQLNSNFPSRWVGSTPKLNELKEGGMGAYTVTPLSAIWYNRATASDGLNLSASNAKEYWWVGDYPKAFWWMQNWPLTPWQASADELTMKDRGLIAVYGANYRGAMYTREPRYVVRNTN